MSFFTFDFENAANYSFDTTKIAIENGKKSLKDLTPLGSTFGATYTSSINANFGNGDLTGTSNNGAARVNDPSFGWVLDLSGGLAGKNVTYIATSKINPTRGVVYLEYIPNYTGNPSNTNTLFDFSNTSGTNNNRLRLKHDTASAWRLDAWSNAGAFLINNQGFGSTALTSGNKYKILFIYDFTPGQETQQLYVNEVQTGSTLSRALARDDNFTSVTHMVLGSSAYSEFFLDNVVFFDNSNRVTDPTDDIFVPETRYSTDTPLTSYNNGFYITELLGFTETVTKNGNQVKYILFVNGQARWHDGAQWTNSDGSYAQANTADEINTNASTFVTARAFVKVSDRMSSTDGSSTPEMDEVTIEFDSGLPDPELPRQIDVEGFLYYKNCTPAEGVQVRARPYQEGGPNFGVFELYEFVDVATSDANGFFDGCVFVQPSEKLVEFKIGRQRYKTELPDQDSVDISTLTFELVVD